MSKSSTNFNLPEVEGVASINGKSEAAVGEVLYRYVCVEHSHGNASAVDEVVDDIRLRFTTVLWCVFDLYFPFAWYYEVCCLVLWGSEGKL